MTDAEDEEEIYPRLARRGSLDGILFQSDQMGDQLINKLAQSGIPLVIIGRPFQNDTISYIDIDNVSAAISAFNHLFNLGYKRIGTITGPLNTTVGIDRKTGFIQAMKDKGLQVEDGLIVEGDFTDERGYSGLLKLLPAKPCDFRAFRCMVLAPFERARIWLRVPEDIAFVGFDDLPVSNPVNLPLSTVRQPVYEFGIKAVEFLNDLITNGTTPPRHTIMGTELIVRDSCGMKIKKS